MGKEYYINTLLLSAMKSYMCNINAMYSSAYLFFWVYVYLVYNKYYCALAKLLKSMSKTATSSVSVILNKRPSGRLNDAIEIH